MATRIIYLHIGEAENVTVNVKETEPRNTAKKTADHTQYSSYRCLFLQLVPYVIMRTTTIHF